MRDGVWRVDGYDCRALLMLTSFLELRRQIAAHTRHNGKDTEDHEGGKDSTFNHDEIGCKARAKLPHQASIITGQLLYLHDSASNFISLRSRFRERHALV